MVVERRRHVVTGVDDEPAADQSDPVDAAIERMERMRPQELFETFADMELAWGPNWSGSLKSLWLGEGEAIGDITVGEELAEQLGTEPMHPVLMDLCTGVAFPAFPALLAAEQGVNDLFLPLRYGQVTLREKMPRRFYCRAKWHTSDSTAKPRSSISISSIGMAAAWAGSESSRSNVRPARRCCAGSAAMPPGCCTPSAGTRCRFRRRATMLKRQRHLAGRRIRRTGGGVAGLHPVRPG